MNAKMEDIRVENLRKSFGSKPVLEDFSATFPAGQVSIIMGESGCGKTTLLNIILGIEKPDSGRISGVPARVSAVFQEDRLCEDFSAGTNVRITAAEGISQKEISDALTALGLGDNIKTPVRELSGGMRRRVAIARAMLAESALVILDEPFTGLDSANRAAAAAFILSRLNGRTLIAVTHLPADAELLGACQIIKMT
ncbi:MAG: ATP-binding cassette domain-containing protein [Eubacteriales bacterium]|jgi:NitT/TauT family transport system ATP-binding protein